MLSKRQIMNMKWRTAFMAAIICVFFMFGDNFKADNTARTEGFGRHLLDTDDSEGGEDVSNHGAGLADRPDCRQDEEMFKRQLKKWFRNVPKPITDSQWMVTCPCGRDDKMCKESCADPYNGTWILKITTDKCRTFTWNCTRMENGIEIGIAPPEEDDAMFPKDAFTEEQRANGAFILHLIGVLYMFYALALVCDHYFVPALDVIIERYGISPDVAGATLMAAGGSAPELFTSIIGVFIAISDVGIGTIVGSAVFNVLFVIAACAFASAQALELTAWPLIRDTTFYSIALLMLVVFFTDDLIEWWEALILFIWYFCYVIFMKFNPQAEAKFLSFFPNIPSKKDEDEAMPAGFKYNPKRKPLLALMKRKVEAGADDQEVKSGVGMEGLKMKLQGPETENLNGGDKDEDKHETESNKDDEEEYKDYIRAGPGDDLLSKIMWFLSLPLMVPMWITIPDPQDKNRAKFFPIAFVMSILWIAAFSYFMVWWATLVGQALGISDAVMGLTFLAAGTSVPDLITSVLVAKDGKGDMAVSSSIGSNLFDVTVGLPLPWLLYCAINQKAIDVNSVGMACNIGMLFVMLLVVFLSILAFKWKMTKIMGGIMLVMYVIFVVVSLGLTECWFACPI